MKKAILLFALFFVYQLNIIGHLINRSDLNSFYANSVENFTGIHLKNSANVFITQGDVSNTRIEADDDVRSNIIIEIKNDVLTIRSEKESYSNKQVNIYITVKDLNSIELSGSGSITTQTILKSEKLLMQISGSGDIHANVEAKEVKMVVAGSGNIDVNGETEESNIKIIGSGNVEGIKLKTLKSTISITGSGKSKVDVGNELNVSITGSGNVYYLSEPKKINSKITGSGKIKIAKADKFENEL